MYAPNMKFMGWAAYTNVTHGQTEKSYLSLTTVA